MSFDTVMRIFFGLCALFFAGLLVRSLVTGRTILAARKLTRAEDRRTYWGAIGIDVLVVLTIAVAAFMPERLRVPVFLIGVMTSQLLTARLAGEIPRLGGKILSREKGDAGYRNMVIFYWVMLATP
jgi:hypothetical protein